MDCFTHEGAVAVGACCNCGKGTCRTCAVDLGYALTCGERCAEFARNRYIVESRNHSLYGVGGRKPQISLLVLMAAVPGVVFLGSAILNAVTYGELDIASIIGAVGFFGITVVAYLRNRRIAAA
jgi:hypothetical protein